LIKLNEAQMNSAAMFAVLIVMAALGIALHWAIVTVSSNWLKRYK
jgi:ABC-type nitrate/sulfonate/bicarbonate transport system permease component